MFVRIASSIAVLVLVASSVLAQQGAADRLFAAGDSAGALEQYEAVLRTEPANVHALIRSAQLHSWTKRYAEAVARYDRVLKINPAEPTARLERAKVLSWAGRYAESAVAFRQILAADPASREAQLGVARALSWSGQQTPARQAYEVLLARNGNDIDALVGVAQTWAWSGQGVTAKRWYERALAADPASRAARIGLAYMDLEQARRGAAARTAQELAGIHPKDGDVVDLARAVKRARTPSAEVTFDSLSDSDDNDLRASRARVVVPFAAPVDLGATISRYEMESGSRSGSVDAAHLQLVARRGASQRFTIRGGVDRMKTSAGSRDVPTGSLSYSVGNEGSTLFSLSANRDTFKYSVPILDNRIVVNSYASRLTRSWPVLRLESGAAFGDFSDGNRRTTADAALLFKLPLRSARIESGYSFRHLDFDEAAGHGYFDPQRYAAHALLLRAGGRFGASRTDYALSLEGGVQSFTFRGIRTSDDAFAGGTLTVGFPLASLLRLELSANKSTSAVNAATGFESQQLTARLRLQR